MSIEYNEDNGTFIIKENNFWNTLRKIFGLGDKTVYESDLGVNKINELKEILSKTTLTEQDTDVLYKFACLEFNYNKPRQDFLNEPLKNIFKLYKDNVCIGKLMPMAYDYTNKIVKGEKPMIEKFDAYYDYYYAGSNYLEKILLIICFLLYIIAFYFLMKN
jgi:hypothetical protein